MILADTSVWIDFFRGAKTDGRFILSKLIEDEEDLAITEIIITEVLQGIRDERDFQAIKESLLNFTIIKPEGTETYIRAANIYRDCRKKGKTVRKTIDCVIAAICIENSLVLLHNDSDFDNIAKCARLKCLKS